MHIATLATLGKERDCSQSIIKVTSDRFLIDKGPVIINRLVGRFGPPLKCFFFY